jgi:hypothetical protein
MLRLALLLAFLAPGRALAQWWADSVLVSRRALVMSFPVDTSAQPESRPAAGVTLVVDLQRRSPRLEMSVIPPATEPGGAASVRPVTCQASIDRRSCRDSTTVEIVNRRFVITVHDSAMVALLFAARPPAVVFYRRFGRPGGGYSVVHYVDPPFVPASEKALAAEDSVRGSEGWSAWTRTLWTSSPIWMSSPTGVDTIRLQVGDRVTARVDERQYRGIDQVDTRFDLSASGWISSDSAVAALEADDPRRVEVTIVGLRPGGSRVAVRGLHGPSDDLPRSARTSTFVLNVIVIKRLAGVRITPRPTTIVAGSEPELKAQLIDEAGAVVNDVRVSFLVFYDWPDTKPWGEKRYGLAADADFKTTGHRRFIASFGKLADTLDLEVIPRGAPAAAVPAENRP